MKASTLYWVMCPFFVLGALKAGFNKEWTQLLWIAIGFVWWAMALYTMRRLEEASAAIHGVIDISKETLAAMRRHASLS